MNPYELLLVCIFIYSCNIFWLFGGCLRLLERNSPLYSSNIKCISYWLKLFRFCCSGVWRAGVCLLLLWVPPWWFTALGLHGLNSLPAHEHVEEESLTAGDSATTPGARVTVWQAQLLLEMRACRKITLLNVPSQYISTLYFLCFCWETSGY